MIAFSAFGQKIITYHKYKIIVLVQIHKQFPVEALSILIIEFHATIQTFQIHCAERLFPARYTANFYEIPFLGVACLRGRAHIVLK